MTASILIADDNPADIDLLMLAFEESGLQAEWTVANDGLRAIELLQTATPALILLDIKMPGADGFEVLTYLRGQARLRDVQVIVMSSSSASADQERALRLGASRFWTKPERFEDILRFVASLRGLGDGDR